MKNQRQQGYALLLVLGAIALLSLVLAQLAQRVDRLRGQVLAEQEELHQAVSAHGAWSAAMFALNTREPGAAGWGEGVQALRGDGRLYKLPDGALISIQDQRGLLSVNMVDRGFWRPLLKSTGLELRDADALLDVLEDYSDNDSAKRLNGAEEAEYRALGLPPPRNDWLLDVEELGRMPIWRERGTLRDQLRPWLTTGVQPVLNPNTASIDLLTRLHPGVPLALWQQFAQTREQRAPIGTDEFRTRIGLNLDPERYVFSVGPQVVVTLYGNGSRRGLQYNLRLLPAGRISPWLVSAVTPVHRTLADPSNQSATPLVLDGLSDAAR